MPIPPPRLNPGGNKKPKFAFSMYWMYAIIIIILVGMLYMDNNSQRKDVDFSKFKEILASGGVQSVTIHSSKHIAEAEVNDSIAKTLFNGHQAGTKAIVECNIPSGDKMQEYIDTLVASGQFKGNVNYDNGSSISSYLWSFGPIVLLIVFWIWMMRRMSGRGDGGGGVFSVGKSKAKIFDKDGDIKVTFNDVAGLSEAKVEIEEIVEFLKNPQRYTNLGGKIPKGALLVGPPGTGKTLLAKAVAGEANVPFFSLSGSDFVEMFVGVGASRVRDLFRQAKEKAPCIVFIDEIDAVGRARGKNPNMGSNDERENTLNALLTEMDGFGTNSGVIVLAATNRVDILDKALLRAGRFDRQIFVDLPDLNDRVAIFKVHLRKIKIDPNLDIDLLARQTPGFSGADIANVCNEAALIAARHNKTVVDRQDFTDAVDRIIGGLEKRSKITTEDEKRSIAIHEAGHATVSWHLQYGDPLIKVTIVPRGKALGAAWYLPEERQLVPTQAMLDKICSLMGGRASEELFTGMVGTGALNDLERATKMAYSLVVYYGMSKSLPNISYYDSTGQEYGFTKPYSEERSKIIDEEVSRILTEQYERAKEILTRYADGVKQLANELVTNEVIFTEDVEKIFGKRPWVSRTDEILAHQAAPAITDGNPDDNTNGNANDKSDDNPACEKNTEKKTDIPTDSEKKSSEPSTTSTPPPLPDEE